jgi:predicted phage baseplate assembly protein
LRFGDGIYGRQPSAGVPLQASYRIGNGSAGNVGADAITHVVTDVSGITAVRNPLPAQGGTDPESLEEVRLYAPQAFRTQERAVTEADYAAVAGRHPEVQKAMATRRWTGSWYTMFVTVDRKGGRLVSPEFEDELRIFLERFRLAGHDLEIDGPRFVPLDIVMTVCVAPGYFRSDVKQALLEVFSSRDLPDGRRGPSAALRRNSGQGSGRGFFHPDNFTFGQPVYLSQVIATAMDVPGVQWVDVDDTPPKPNRFRRWGQPAHGEIDAGLIEMGRLEIARLDNDPSLPENGKIDFIMEGGL